MLSHPTGVRGLKFEHLLRVTVLARVAPHWGAWIEISALRLFDTVGCESHPTGVRGLKLTVFDFYLYVILVAPHWGAWIEIPQSATNAPSRYVAPHWGAWIEIAPWYGKLHGIMSHPTGVRGLKSFAEIVRAQVFRVAPHWGAWIEI